MNFIIFLNTIKKELHSGVVIDIYNRFENEYITIDVHDDKCIEVYFNGDKSVGECNLNFMKFDSSGKFSKSEDYDDMNDDLSLDVVKKVIEKNIYILSSTQANTSNAVLKYFDYVVSGIEETTHQLKIEYSTTFKEKIEEYKNNDKKLSKIYAKLQDIERKLNFSIEELKKEV